MTIYPRMPHGPENPIHSALRESIMEWFDNIGINYEKNLLIFIIYLLQRG